ncbi:COX15/CtaA family protein [Marinitenerispora sediminis]|uniref:Heme A synthase n=1 Tax=Marinitenerispora sediminis TaxID=1931232 RepID=A0A368T607_9ACTN|nr:COX15/CtaA family protein [Marinitenerispora sediminis]RCV51520.1 heme A synthase [Marinitenerispora sediminis]RCV55193.1 heme A synthase [Marinitenerispora sediminis]RCV59133.1 heme A synthase [Marinitenerispora sediminis]
MNGLPSPTVFTTVFTEDTIEILHLPLWAWQIVFAVVGVLALVALARTIWQPTTRTLRWWGLGNIVVNAGIAVTGATVRVTESGLGCSEWPRCTEDSFVPIGGDHAALNAAIEFGNRTLTFLVLTVGVIVFVATLRLRPRRRDLLRLATIIPFGVLGQGVVGGITVWSDLHPASVGAHFLLSTLVVVLAMAFYVRCREPEGELRPVVAPLIRRIAAAMVVVGFLLLVAGTVVTGTGPHGGDAAAPRWGFDMVAVTRLHSALAWLTVLGALALVVLLARTGAPRRIRGLAWLLVAALLGQGVVGYAQYLLALPEGLVVLHVLGSMLVWTAILRVYFGTAERVAVTTPADGSAAAAGAAGAAIR